jgi:hypothetical protein
LVISAASLCGGDLLRGLLMTTQQLPIVEKDGLILDDSNPAFSSAQWLSYFQSNKESRINISFAKHNSIPASTRAPLIWTLQRFQIGETGEGNHLRKYARMTNDPDYEQCIDLFIKEEQYHALVLAQMIQSMDGVLLTWHWSDLAFIGLRRMLGLKTELLILLIAEIIGKCFYNACANNLKNSRFSDAFSLIVLDEIGHLEFHCEFLRDEMKPLPPIAKKICYFAWCVLFFSACLVFIVDNMRALEAINVSPRNFLNDCSSTFYRAAVRVKLSNIKEN